MVTLTFFFYAFVVLFGVIGAMRGWAKELLVTFSVILAIFIITVFERFVPTFGDVLARSSPEVNFWVRTTVITLFAFFGYQTPNLPRIGGARFARERLQDTLLGLFLGALNGYFIIGTLWFYLDQAGYPFPFIFPPDPNTQLGSDAAELLNLLPPRWLGVPTVYFAVAVAFAFVVIVFV